MNKTALRASIKLDLATEMARTTGPIGTRYLPEPSGLTQAEIRQIVLDLIG